MVSTTPVSIFTSSLLSSSYFVKSLSRIAIRSTSWSRWCDGVNLSLSLSHLRILRACSSPQTQEKMSRSGSDICSTTETKRSQSTFVSQPNPVTGKMDWVLQDEDYDYVQEIARSGYGDMLHDTDRNVKYFAAIRAAVKLLKSQGKQVNVLDIGTGTGLLSMMAVKSGADTVTACEAFHPMAECAKKVIAENGMADKIKLIPKRSTDVLLGKDLPRRANLLVTELFDTELIGEGAIMSYSDAHNRLMESDCVAVPTLGLVYIQAVHSSTLSRFNTLQPVSIPGDATLRVPEEYGQCGGAPSLHDLQIDELEDELSVLSEPAMVFWFDFSRRGVLRYEEHRRLTLPMTKNGRLDAFVMWWDLQMDPQGHIWLSCGPRWTRDLSEPVPWRDHWMQAVYYPSTPVEVHHGQEVELYCGHDEYSLWFDIGEPKWARPVCHCGLHVTLSRSRLAEMNNKKAISTYTSALRQHIRPTSTCLVISEGSLLPLIAAGLGASKVFYLDRNYGTSKIFRQILVQNKEMGEVKILDKDPEHITAEDLDHSKIDIVISEPFCVAAHLPWEHIYFWYALSAMQEHLSPDVVVLPRTMTIKAIGLQFRDLHKIRMPVGICEGFDISSFDKLIQSSCDNADPELEAQPLWEYPGRALTEPAVVGSLDFTRPVSDTSTMERSVNLQGLGTGSLNGLAFWTEFDFGDNLTINRGIQDDNLRDKKVKWDKCSRQAVHLFPEAHRINQGSEFRVKSRLSPLTGDFSVNLSQDKEDL